MKHAASRTVSVPRADQGGAGWPYLTTCSKAEDSRGCWSGVGVALAAPIVLPAAAAGARPLARALIKGGLLVATTVREMVAEAGEQLSDLVAEVQAEQNGAASEARPE